ncbi:MAG: hypothetical protein PHG66_04825 [Candidatus Colwellbacteria bacterium]|nr:hypothetical protein [Candidatus Colwellbacteria bacterium]
MSSKVPIIIENDYKFRSECSVDTDRFVELFKDYIISIERKSDPDFPDEDVEFSSLKSLDEIRLVMKEIEDGHVMLESLNYADEYTGDRYYDEE